MRWTWGAADQLVDKARIGSWLELQAGHHTALKTLQVPVGIVEEIINRAGQMVQRAVKSKCIIKSNDDADHE